MRFRPSTKLKCQRDQLILSDGGTVVIDSFPSTGFDKDTPIVMIIHTLCGGTREPCSNNFAEYCVNQGWRAVVLNNRGCSGAPLTSKRFYNAVEMDDIQFMVNYIKEKYHPPHLFLAGFSLGAVQAIHYSTIDPSINATACISHTYDSFKMWFNFR